MAWHLYGAKPLPKPMMTCEMDHMESILLKDDSK